MTGESDAAGDAAEPVLTGPDAVKDAPPGDRLAEAYAAGLEVARVPALVPRIAPGSDRAALRALTELLATGRYDVVHTHSAKAGALGRLAARRAGVGRIVHTYHGFPFHEFQPPWRRGLYVWIERRLSRYTDAFLAVGAGVAAEAIRRGLAGPDRVRTIPPAVDTVAYPPGNAARGQARRRLGLPPGIRLVGTVGRVDYQKAPELWVDGLAAAATGGDVWGLWVGDGPQRQKLQARVRRRGLADRFVWLGHRDDVAELLPAFDVFALASRYEGLPCVLVEAIGAGVPVVATAVNAVPDLIIPGETGLLVPPGRPAAFGAAVRHLLDEPTDARRMADAARSRLGDRFTPEALATVLDQTYRKK